MKEKTRSYTFYLKFLLIILLFLLLSACGGVTPGTDFSTIPDTAALAVGDYFQGGRIAYIFVEGDPGYVPGETHGLVAAEVDQSTDIIWALPGHEYYADTRDTIGSGWANTDKIIIQNGEGTTYAAGLARAYRGGGYSDWFLPSRDELYQLYLNRDVIGGFADHTWYWSSSEYTSTLAWLQYFSYGFQQVKNKFNLGYRVRAVRAF
jgi:hypothetical protein